MFHLGNSPYAKHISGVRTREQLVRVRNRSPAQIRKMGQFAPEIREFAQSFNDQQVQRPYRKI